MVLHRRADTKPLLPIVLSPSGTFDGNDGRWSTFTINVAGDGEGKGQNFKVLISTSSPMTVVPARTSWCSTDECAKRRGIMDAGSFGLNTDLSSLYSPAGLYTLPFALSYGWSRSLLPPGGNGTLDGQWGTTNIGLGAASKQSMTIPDQYVASYYFTEFFLGSLGLSAGSVSANGATKQSFFNGLAGREGTIPSSSYGFTAGAIYRNGGRGVPGNMVFGGYDKSRLVTGPGSVLSIPMPSKQDNTLIVGVNSILYTPDQKIQPGSVSITPTDTKGFSAVIDSTLPYLVLPDDICDKFVEMFKLKFDNTTGLYTIDSRSHDYNNQQNATVSFKIGSQPGDTGPSTTIVLPYDAFYLPASAPIYTNTTYYFPIRKSGNGRYILGRTFLQEAYIVVDYERTNFTVAPAFFSNPMPRENIATIHNLNYTPLPRASGSGSGDLAAGAIAGIVIGIVAAFLILGVAGFFLLKRRRKSRAAAMDQERKPTGIATLGPGGDNRHRHMSELSGSEAHGSPQFKAAGYFGGDHKTIPELSPDSPPAELYSPPLDGTSEPDYFTAGQKSHTRGPPHGPFFPGISGPPVAELAADERATVAHRPQHTRGPSDNSLSTNIDEVLAGKDQDSGMVQRKHSSRFVEHTGDSHGVPRDEMVVSPVENTRSDETGIVAERSAERRPSHTRGLSETTVASDNTVVSEPTPEELESWSRHDDAPKRS